VNQTLLDVMVGIALVVAAVGIVVPILPGTLLAMGALLVWAILTGGSSAWAAFVIGAVLMTLGQVLKYLIPHKSLRSAGVPSRSILIGAVVAVIGFFAIPAFGLPLGFIAGVLISEVARVGKFNDAWDSTWVAMKATGFAMLIELFALMLAMTFWVGGVIASS
jgi:uncharacterized protein